MGVVIFLVCHTAFLVRHLRILEQLNVTQLFRANFDFNRGGEAASTVVDKFVLLLFLRALGFAMSGTG